MVCCHSRAEGKFRFCVKIIRETRKWHAASLSRSSLKVLQFLMLRSPRYRKGVPCGLLVQFGVSSPPPGNSRRPILSWVLLAGPHGVLMEHFNLHPHILPGARNISFIFVYTHSKIATSFSCPPSCTTSGRVLFLVPIWGLVPLALEPNLYTSARKKHNLPGNFI